jgi:ABC-2 type transport system permease protein
VVNGAIYTHRFAQAGLPPQKALTLLQPVPLLAKGLSKRNPVTGAIEDPPTESQVVHFLLPISLVGLMFMLIMVGATPLMQGVVEEKMQRIAEVLLGSVSPFQLMMGKLLGMIGVSLTILAVYAAGIYAALHHYGYTEYLPLGLLAWFVVFQTMAVVMYGSLFIAIGAACSDTKETQTLVMPVMVIACLPLFFMVPIIEKPNGAFALGASLFPPATPMLMIIRQAVPPGIPWWQPVLGVVVVLATTALLVYAAGRILRVGILMQGKGARMGDLVKWVVQG